MKRLGLGDNMMVQINRYVVAVLSFNSLDNICDPSRKKGAYGFH